MRSVPHVGDVFTTEARPAGKMASVMYTVEFDDFNGGSSEPVDKPGDPGRMARGKRSSLPKGESLLFLHSKKYFTVE